jgi:hypothetical protein
MDGPLSSRRGLRVESGTVMETFFESVRQTPAKMSSGTCDLPILYRDASQFGVFFRIELERAQALLEGTALEPWPVLGAAMGAIYVWEYRDSTVGSYNELGLGIQARRRGTRPSLVRLGLDMRAQLDQGIWVVNLPVTTQGAYQAGVEIWGYPKYVTPIETRFDDGGASVRLGDELELSLGPMRGPAMKLPVVTYTARGGRLLRTVIEVKEPVRWGTAASARLRVLGDGPTASSVKKLGLESARPLLAFRTDRFQAILPAGDDLGPAGVSGPRA